MRASEARTGLSARPACHRSWLAYGTFSPLTPEVGAVCGKAARTDLCGGREVTRVPTAKFRRLPVLAQNGPAGPVSRCPLIGADRKQRARRQTGKSCMRPCSNCPSCQSAARGHACGVGQLQYVGQNALAIVILCQRGDECRSRRGAGSRSMSKLRPWHA
jgi:hypothetical protein